MHIDYKFKIYSDIMYFIDISETRLEMAMKLGADHKILLTGQQTIDDIIQEITTKMGERPDVTIECSGAEASINLAISVSVMCVNLLKIIICCRNCTIPHTSTSSTMSYL